MGIMTFLSALPAVLGLTGFVIYFFLARNRQGDRITQDIIGKLRRDAPTSLPAGAEQLSPTALERLLLRDKDLQQNVNQDEFGLLRSSIRFQFILSLVVYAICLLAFLAGIYMYFFLHPSISSISINSLNPVAQGALVDLDPLAVRWSASGTPTNLRVALKNVDTGDETGAKNVASSEGVVEFAPSDYESILRNRIHNGATRTMVLIRTSDSDFASPEFKLLVGTTIVVVKKSPIQLTIMGTVNNRAIDFYNFEAKFLVWISEPGKEPRPITIPSNGAIQYGKNDFPLDPKIKYDWSQKRFVYFSPDDPKIVRVEFLGF